MPREIVYVWDETKRAINIAIHGIDFEAAAEFDWDAAKVTADTRNDYGEDRFIALGLIDRRVHVLIFTERADRIRIISLRKANPREVKRYEEN